MKTKRQLDAEIAALMAGGYADPTTGRHDPARYEAAQRLAQERFDKVRLAKIRRRQTRLRNAGRI